MEPEQTQRILPPKLLFQSFLVVGGGYILSFLCFLASLRLLPLLMFPEIEALWEDPEALQDVIANTPEQFFTKPFFVSLLVVNTIGNFFIGMFAARVAPFAKMPHLVFTALVVLVTFLQLSMSQPQSVKWMFVLMMVLFPCMIVVGGNLVLRKLVTEPNDDAQE